MGLEVKLLQPFSIIDEVPGISCHAEAIWEEMPSKILSREVGQGEAPESCSQVCESVDWSVGYPKGAALRTVLEASI